MNERIKLLAEQAEDYATAEYEKWIPTPDFSGIPNVRKIFNKKFAELLINDCIEAIQNESMNSYDDWERGLLFAEGAIRTHFGVEE